MHHSIPPHIGDWYQALEFPEAFEVVALEGGNEDFVEVQFFNGDIEEIDKDAWHQLHLLEIPAPEDWSGAIELPHEELSFYLNETIRPPSWDDPVHTIEPN